MNVLINKKLLVRQNDLIGSLRCVGFSALDLDLVRGEEEYYLKVIVWLIGWLLYP